MKSKILGGLIVLLAILPFIEIRLTQKGGWSEDIISATEPDLEVSADVLQALSTHSLDFIVDKNSLAIFVSSKYSGNGYYECAGNETFGREVICTARALEVLYKLDEMSKVSLSRKEEIINYVKSYYDTNKSKNWFGPEQIYGYAMVYYYLNESYGKTDAETALEDSRAAEGGFASFHGSAIGDLESTYFALKTFEQQGQNFTETRAAYMDFISSKMNTNDFNKLNLAYQSLGILNVPIDVSLKNKMYCMLDFFNPLASTPSKTSCLNLLDAGKINILIPVIMLVVLGIILMYI